MPCGDDDGDGVNDLETHPLDPAYSSKSLASSAMRLVAVLPDCRVSSLCLPSGEAERDFASVRMQPFIHSFLSLVEK